MDNLAKKYSEILKYDMGENYWVMMSNLYLSKYPNVYDEKYGKGATKFVGEAFEYYSENHK